MNKICKHFDECGGCRFQDIDYKQQLKGKEEKVKSLIQAQGIDCQLKPINFGSPWNYRNKMEFSFARDEKIICGLYSKKYKRKVVDIEECLIFSPDAGEILKAVKDFVNKKEYPVYNKFSHKGFLRNLIIRETKITGELMVGIVTSGSEALDTEVFLKTLLELKTSSRLKSIYWIVNDSLSDAVIFDKKNLLYGEETILENLDGLGFNIGIDTFFQVNPRMVVDFYSKIRDYINPNDEERVLDLFCGVGSISLFLAKRAKFVWGIEVSKEIVDLAFQNARENKIDNVSFIVSDVRRFLNTQGAFYKNIDALVINPPRSGLSNKILRAILRLGPKRILYSSCNPVALFKDLSALLEHYKPDFVEPFDFFPHTPHLECLAFLTHK